MAVLKEVIPVAEHTEVEIHLETDLYPDEFARLLTAADHALVRANYDTGNSASLGYDAQKELTLLGPWLGSVHIKDRLRGGGTVPLGAGAVDFGACFRMLREIGFEGPFILQAARDEILNEVELAARNRRFVEERFQAAALAVPGDMTELSGVQEAFERTSATFGRLDIVVANVGSGTAPTGWQLSREDWQAVLDANLLGGMVLATEALARMLEEQRGSLVMVSSIAGSEAIGAPAPYSAAKAALQSAVKSLSRLAGPHSVRVNAVAPGNVLFPGGSWEGKLAERREFFEDYIQREVPLKRFGVPEEIADTAVFLASERASFVTGACWVVDGGQTRSFC